MKCIYGIVFVFCSCSALLSCAPAEMAMNRGQERAANRILQRAELDTIEQVKINNSMIEIYTAYEPKKFKTHEFWYVNDTLMHSAQYGIYDINYKWLVDLDGDNDVEVIRAQGYEDGVDYGIYTVSGNKEKLLMTFNPALLDARYPNLIFWGYPWDMETLVMNDAQEILSSTPMHYERDDNCSMAERQTQMPFIFFHGKTTQPEFKIKIEASKVEYTNFEELMDWSVLPIASPSDLRILRDVEWKISCDNWLTYMYFSGDSVEFNLYTNNHIDLTCHVKWIAPNTFELYFKNVSFFKEYYPEALHLDSGEISQEIPVARCVLSSKQIVMDWYGLYNSNKDEYQFVDEFVFRREYGGQNPILIRRCK